REEPFFIASIAAAPFANQSGDQRLHTHAATAMRTGHTSHHRAAQPQQKHHREKGMPLDSLFPQTKKSPD
ncbi:hypothetical protein, partial [Stutzerimonas kunmingensis]|uniref:hypothetical protein n=1 Tax=Stutzerimonas kunmingensis TaxID=1211807 RepID=UPI00241E5D96